MTEATYAGTTGWSGTDTSREQAEPHRQWKPQREALASAARHTTYGITVADLRNWFPASHHGSLSSALTNLHRAGRLARLVDKRDGCHIYTLPEFVVGRATEPPTNHEDKAAALNEQARKEGHDLGWQEGYDRAVAERVDYGAAHAQGHREGRTDAAYGVARHINAMLAAIPMSSVPHTDRCWQSHPACALRAARAAAMKIGQDGPV